MAELTATPAVPPVRRFSIFARTAGGVAAIGAKELRGRMRGRRAFIILTIYLLLLGGFALMVEKIVEANYQFGFGGVQAQAGAAIGQAIFTALLMLMTLQVVFLAPSSTAGAISLEREKQTLELLVTTPISSLAIVIGKLLSALIYVFLLIAASIPLMAAVFVFGGVAPEDVIRGYVVLIVTAIGLGSFGLLCSSLVKRTTAATAITIFGVLAISIGTIFVLAFWQAMGSFDQNGNRRPGPLGIRTPTPVAWINPFMAQADVLCGIGSDVSLGGAWCSLISGLVPSNDGVIVTDGGPMPVPIPGPIVQPAPAIPEKGVLQVGGMAANDVAAVPPQPFGVPRDGLWTRSVALWLGLSALFLVLSVQAVSPTRRWRLRRRGSASTSPAP